MGHIIISLKRNFYQRSSLRRLAYNSAGAITWKRRAASKAKHTLVQNSLGTDSETKIGRADTSNTVPVPVL